MKQFLFFLTLLMMQADTFAQTASLTPETLWKIGRVGLDCISPDGSLAVFGVTRFDVSKNQGTRTLYMVDLETGGTQPISDPDKTASDAEFHPSGDRVGFLMDGKLYEVRYKAYMIVAQVSDIDMNGFHYSPDGRSVLYTQDVRHDLSATDKYPELPKANGRIIDGLFYRHWKSWHDYRYSNLFYTGYENGKLTGQPVAVLNERYDTPLRPMGGMEQISWSPDGRFIAYTCRKLNGTQEALSTNSDIYLYETATGNTTNLSESLPGYDIDPVFSPDGQYVAWTSMERPGNESDRPRLMAMDLRSRSRTELTQGWTYEALHPQWAPDGQSLYFISSKDFTYQLYQIGLKDRNIRPITNGRHDFTSFKVAGKELIGTRTAMDSPAELYAVNPQNGEMRRMTFMTDDPWASVSKGAVERHTVKTKDGQAMNVWMIYPPGFDPAKKYPALLYCQGGPQSALSQGFSYRWNFQLMAAKGYIVIAPCRRGMPGSGQAWNDAITGDWGGMPMQDMLSASDYAAKLPGVDPARMGAVGASYGGYTVYWLAGNHQKRFKAFISHCGLFNLESFYGATEELWFANHDLEGAYWTSPKPKSYTKDSPHLYVQNWDTPILVIHNELDFRVPFGEGMQAFQAAQLRGIPSRFLTFSDEGHWVTKPQNSLLWQRVFFDWLDAYLK